METNIPETLSNLAKVIRKHLGLLTRVSSIDFESLIISDYWNKTMPLWLRKKVLSESVKTNWGRVTHMRRWSNHHWFRQWLVARSAPSHYLNQCWYICIVNWTLRKKLNLVKGGEEINHGLISLKENIACERNYFKDVEKCTGVCFSCGAYDYL